MAVNQLATDSEGLIKATSLPLLLKKCQPIQRRREAIPLGKDSGTRGARLISASTTDFTRFDIQSTYVGIFNYKKSKTSLTFVIAF